MDKIILAYCRENSDIALLIDQRLSRIGMPFEHLTNQPGAMPGQFAAWVQSTNSPVVLIITDNFLKNQGCMASALNMLQQLVRNNRIIPVVADGKIQRNGTEEAISTKFDRVIHAIQYMNFWQSSYLEVRAQKEHISPADEGVFEDRLNVVRDISAEIGEFLNLLREANYVPLSEFEASDYRIFFEKFGISDWHEMYCKIAASDKIGLPHESVEKVSVVTGLLVPQSEGKPDDVFPEPNFEPNDEHTEIETTVQPNTSIPMPEDIVSPSSGINTEKYTGMDAVIDEIMQEEEDMAIANDSDALDQNDGQEEIEFLFEEKEVVPETKLRVQEVPLQNIFSKQETAPVPPPIVVIRQESTLAVPDNTLRREPEPPTVREEEIPPAPVAVIPPAPVAVEPPIPVVITPPAPVAVEPPIPVAVTPPAPVVINPPEQVLPLATNKVAPEEKETPNTVVSRTVPERIYIKASSPLTPFTKTVQSEDENIAMTIKDAEFWINKGYHDKALQVYEQAVREYPHNDVLSRAYILALAKTGKTNEAVQKVEEMMQNGENWPGCYDLLAQISVMRGDYLAARSFWEKTLSLNPTYPKIYQNLGELIDDHLTGYKRKAAEYLKLAVEQDPENIGLHHRLANLLFNHLDKPKKAIKYYLNTVALQNEHPTAWHEMALAYHESGDFEKAAECYQRAVKISPALKNDSNDKLFAFFKAPVPVIRPKNPKEILTVMVTGATSGIGRATAEIFAQNGHRLILTGRRAERLAEIKDNLAKSYHNEVHTLRFDVRDQASVEQALANLPENWRDIDILINNAGLAKGFDPIHEGKLEHWEQMIDTNIKGLLYVTHLVSPHMVRRRKGHIINIGSIAGKEIYPKGNVYCATKAAVDALTKAIRMDLYTYNIRVSEVSPGHVEETEFAINRFDGDAEKAKIYSDFQPLKSSDVAEVVYFIATRPAHVNLQDVVMYGTQQASATMIDRSGR